MKQLLSVATLCFLFGCQNTPDTSKGETPIDSMRNTKEQITVDSFYIDESEINGGAEYKEYTTDTIVNICFDEFSVKINRLVVYEHSDSIYDVKKDTLFLTIELAETIEGQQINLSQINIENIVVEQAYETSVTVMNEGPHCDLLDWNHYTSPWIPLQTKSKNIYIAKKYTETERQLFPEVSLDELKKTVKNYCESKWFKLIGDIKSVNDYPCAVGISKYFIRISGVEPITRKKIVKLIILEQLMGC